MITCTKWIMTSMRFRLSYTLKRPKTLIKLKRFESAPFLVWTGENGDHDGKSVIHCRFHQRFR